MVTRSHRNDDRDWRDSPVAWLAVYERALASGDEALAARAQAELYRLGVRVTRREGTKQ